MNNFYAAGLTARKRVTTSFVAGLFSLFLAAEGRAQGCASPTFAGAVAYDAGTVYTNSVALGDLNGDGKTDMVATCYSSVLVYLNNGSGGFGTPVSYTAGTNPIFSVIRDLNGDGKPDLAVANEGSKNFSVLFNTGSGTFGAPTNYTAGNNPYVIRAGDLNGDGKPDLVVVNNGSYTVSVFFNNGSGGFAPASTLAVGTGPQDAVIRDLNGDGKADLAVTIQYGNNVSVFLNNGSGGFGAAANYAVGSAPIMMDAGDLNGDGKVDLVVANSSSNSVSVLLGNGSGGFAAAVNYAVGTGPQAVVIGDVTGDGKPDLAAMNYNDHTISVLKNTGTGSFGAPTNFAAGTGPGMAAFGDINGDRKGDLAVTDYSGKQVNVFVNNCSASTYVPLPVQLTALKATEQNGRVQLAWTVADEQGIAIYEVEKSAGGGPFEKIGDVPAANKTAYAFVDPVPGAGTNDYRLRIVERDGSYRYSGVVALRIGTKDASVSLYPNPVRDHRLQLQLINQPAGSFTVQLYNNLGQRVMSREISHAAGSSVETVVLPARVGRGLYRAVVEGRSGRQSMDLWIE